MAQDEMMLVPVKPDIEMLKAMVRYWQSLPGQIPFAHLDRGTEDALIGKAIYTWEAALSAAPAQPAAVEGAGEPVAWQAMKEGRPLGSVWPYANRSGADLWVAGGVGDAVRPLYAHPSPRADDALRLAAIVAKNMADNASFNLNQAGLTIETAACDRAFVDIYRTLDAALKAGGVK